MDEQNNNRIASDPETLDIKSDEHMRLGAVSVFVQNATVKYRTETSDRATLNEASIGTRISYRLFGRRPRYIVNALRNVSLVAREGESIGLVGLNGSGKSTLLRLIAGSEPPTSGEVRATSQPVLLGVSAALLPQLSGIANIRIGCLAMGMSPSATKTAIPSVIELADLGDAIYLPMRTYSAGMASRLRFAIATASRPEILLIDEALNTGDAAFKDRSQAAMTEMRKSAGTVFLVSHAAQTIENMCTRAIWLHRGTVIADGDAYYVARLYRQWSWHLAKGKSKQAAEVMKKAREEYAKIPIVPMDVEMFDDYPKHVASSL